MEAKQNIVYEWVLTLSRGDEPIILSEKQYAFYKENYQENKIFFSNVEFNPAFVVSAYKRPAIYLKDKYPCHTCYSSGRKPGDTGWCEKCGGSGVNLPQ